MTTLYERLGGADAINAVVEGMYQKIFTDEDLIDFFRKTDKPRQLEMQRQFLTYAFGGSSEWHGKSMKESHRGRGITTDDFNKVAGHVVSTMKELSVPQELIDEVVAILLTLVDDCVDEE
ncbi:globin [Stylonychia lemnae]|uniref:Group 1 truncated hemoglobin n=1 Tax=Stylonychia lemnae TaxID=5949 RepID=A0A078ABH4_STYLE|nr:globin [Stylonychia lemnae]|eukprot:CDW78927.1 globin [Stylonychia lemnae]